MATDVRRDAGRARGLRSRLQPAELAGALVGLVLLAAACSSGSTGPGVASLGSTTASATLPAASQGGVGSANYNDAVAYARCMRTHGVPNMPDPNAKGEFLSYHGKLNGEVVNPNSAQFAAADKACRHLLANGGQITPAEQQQLLAETLKFVACMRAHGLANFPDPTTSGGGVGIDLGGTGIRPDSLQYQTAEKACRSLQPGGGP